MKKTKRTKSGKILAFFLMGAMALSMSGCSQSSDGDNTSEVSDTTEATTAEVVADADWEESDYETLRYVFDRDFGGSAGVCLPVAALSNATRMEIVTSQFNMVTMENETKPETLLGQTPTIGDDGFPVLDFTVPDTILKEIQAYNATCPKEEKKIKVRGHVLVWHSQTPEWFFHEDYDANKPYVDKATMLTRMENYIKQVMEHFDGEDSEFRGMFYAWDVANEVVNDTDGGVRTNSSWFNIFYNNDFVVQAFVYANKYAPADVKLFYNDYNDTVAKKADGICKLIEAIKKNPDARIDGMGMQGHYDMTTSTSEFEEAARKYAALVDEIQITELDVKSSNDYDGSDQEGEYLKQAYLYKSLYDTVVRLKNEENIPFTAIVFWGTDDGNSWLQSSNSVGGSADGNRPQCPLLFDASYQPKPAFWAFVNPSKLPPYVQNLHVVQSDDFEVAEAVEFGEGSTKVSFKPIWNETGLGIKVTVMDTSEDDNDAISVFADLTDSRTDGATVWQTTVARKDAEATNRGYETEIYIDAPELTGFSNVGFDISVTNGDTTISWNDTSNSQTTSSKYYGRMVLKPFASIQKGTVTVDGVADDIWNNAQELPLTVISVEGGQPEASAVGKAVWDENALYVWMEVTDPNPDVTGEEVHLQDSVEVFVDEQNTKANSYGPSHKQYRVNYENEQSFNGPNCTADHITSVVTKTESGYIVEMAIAWTEIEPTDGTLIGFELQINDCKDGSRLGMINWYDTTNTCWSSPSSYGTAKLVDGN